MSAISERTRNNVALGIWMTVTIAVLFVVMAILSDALEWLKDTKSYTMRFTVISGVEGLAPGSDVRVGGLNSGAVTRVRYEEQKGPLQTILVDFKLDAGWRCWCRARLPSQSR